MIEAQGLSRRYGALLAVDAISFRVERGCVAGLLGPNGAGKTTTIRMLTGYLPPSAGSANVAGIDVVRQPVEARRRVGYLPESTPLYAEMRVADYLRFRADLSGVRRRTVREAVDRVIDRCALGEVRRRPIRQLSKGYRQRVGLAAAIVHDPLVLVLDEPTSGLDPGQVIEFRQLIRGLAVDRTIILSTHVLPEAEAMCDEVILIRAGRVAARGTIAELASRLGLRRIELITDAAQPGERVCRVAGVRSVETVPLEAPWHRLVVIGGADEEPRALASAADDLPARLRAALAPARALLVRDESPTLESIFLALVRAEART